MERKKIGSSETGAGEQRTERGERSGGERSSKRARKLTEYGRQLQEKQKVKRMYGMRERQFRRFFREATKAVGATGELLLSKLERRLDNVVFRLKLSSTRQQARQMVVHGHITVNGKRVSSPSFEVEVSDVVACSQTTRNRKVFMEQVIEKRIASAAKVPEWLELIKDDYAGRVLRDPVRADIQTPIEEHHIVELYSK